jgi:serine/threonine-protein kinase
MDELLGKTVDNYKFESILGKGGMGIVYKAYDIKLERYVAIKLLNSQQFQREESIARFEREAKNQAKLSHPNIVAVYGFIEYSNFLGIVMEYVEGESLEKIIDRMKSLHSWDAIYILKQILAAIGYAHSKGFIHRDIKPSNIIINSEGVVKITDFGISKSLFEKGTTKTGHKLGTIFYMSPEQVRAEDVTHHTDIYAIGCTFYEMLIGMPPFFSESDYDVMEMHLKAEIPSLCQKIPTMPSEADQMIQRAMHKQPAQRYNSCEEFLIDVINLEKSVKERHSDLFFGKKKAGIKKSTSYVIIFFALLLFSGLVYVAYTQVFELMESKQLDSLKKYSISRLFRADSSYYTFENVYKQNSNTRMNLNAVSFLPNLTGVIAGDSGLVLYTKDGGNNWLRGNTGCKTTLFDCAIINSGNVFLVGDSSTVLACDESFSSFRKLPLESGYSFYKIHFINGSVGFIAGSRGVIFKTLNGGQSWRKVNTNSSAVLFDIHFLDDKKGFAAGWDGTIMRTDDGGENWLKIENEDRAYLKSIDFLSKTTGLAAGGNGTLLKTDNAGKDWYRVDTKNQVIFQKVKCLNDDFIILAGKKGTILVSKDKGETWTQIRVNFYYDINNFYVTSGREMYIVGVSGAIFKILLIEKEN